jgi:hypothetical protein
VMRQLEESNAGMYLQAEQVLAQAAAADRSKAAGSNPGGGEGAVGADGQRKENGLLDDAAGALGGLSGMSPVKPVAALAAADAVPKFSPSQYLMEIR